MSTALPLRTHRIPRKPAPSLDADLTLSIPPIQLDERSANLTRFDHGEDDYSPISPTLHTPTTASFKSAFESYPLEFLEYSEREDTAQTKAPSLAATDSTSMAFMSTASAVTGNCHHTFIDGYTTPKQQIKDTQTKRTSINSTPRVSQSWNELDSALASLSLNNDNGRPNSLVSSMLITSDAVSFHQEFSLPPLSLSRFQSQNSSASMLSAFPRSAWSDDSSASETKSLRRRPLPVYAPPQPAPFTWTHLPSKFDESALPSPEDLELAYSLYVIAEDSRLVRFGDLWEHQKTVVIFIRHFWCPMCQDYMFSISSNVSAAVLEDVNVKLIIVSNGSWEMIKSYRSIFRTPFEVYTDPTLRVYRALGMTMKTSEKGAESDCGMYIRHGFMTGVGMVVKNALKAGMPFWINGGDISQLGGEFVLGPGLQCSYAHRMTTTRSHVPILVVLQEAGVDMFTPLQRNRSFSGRSFLPMTDQELEAWRRRRKDHLSTIKNHRAARRGGSQWCLSPGDTGSTTSFVTASSASTQRQLIPSGMASSSSISVTGMTTPAGPVPYMVRDAATSTTELDDGSSEYLSIYSGSSRSYGPSGSEAGDEYDDDDESTHSLERSIFMESIINMVATGHTPLSPPSVHEEPPLPPSPKEAQMQPRPRRHTTASKGNPKSSSSSSSSRSRKGKDGREDTFFTGAGLFMTW